MCRRIHIRITEVTEMLSIICMALFLMVFFKLLGVALRVGWGLFRMAMFFVFFPITVVTLLAMQ